MTKKHHATELQMIPVDQIAVLNPRDRNGRVFEEIVGNIKSIGLKKPVTVTPRDGLEDGKRFLLICGEGRLKAFRSLGEKEIPALVVAVSDEDAFIMSLTENIARRKYSALELLVSIKQLNEQGYDKRVIAQKTGLSLDYIKGILLLFEKGEERLLAAVESGRIPLNVAITIAGGRCSIRASCSFTRNFSRRLLRLETTNGKRASMCSALSRTSCAIKTCSLSGT